MSGQMGTLSQETEMSIGEVGKMVFRHRRNNEYIDSKLTNKNVVRIDDYVNNATRMEFMCLKHNRKWKTVPSNVIKSHKNGSSGCRQCAIENAINSWNDEKIDKFLENSFIERKTDSNYVNSNTKMEWLFKPFDNYEFEETFGNIKGKKYKDLTSIKFRNTDKLIDIKIKINNLKIKRIGTCDPKDKKKIEWECQTCLGCWFGYPAPISAGRTGCPFCKKKREKMIHALLSDRKNVFSFYEYQYVLRKDKKIKYIIDFYVEKNGKKYAIEYDGIQHFVPIGHFGGNKRFKQQVKRDRNLDKTCQDFGINLIRIPYTHTDAQILELIDGFCNDGATK